MTDTVQVRVSKKTHKRLLEMRKTEMGTVRLHEVIDKIVEFWDEYEKKRAGQKEKGD